MEILKEILFYASQGMCCTMYVIIVSETLFKIFKISAKPQQQTNEWCRISQL